MVVGNLAELSPTGYGVAQRRRTGGRGAVVLLIACGGDGRYRLSRHQTDHTLHRLRPIQVGAKGTVPFLVRIARRAGILVRWTMPGCSILALQKKNHTHTLDDSFTGLFYGCEAFCSYSVVSHKLLVKRNSEKREHLPRLWCILPCCSEPGRWCIWSISDSSRTYIVCRSILQSFDLHHCNSLFTQVDDLHVGCSGRQEVALVNRRCEVWTNRTMGWCWASNRIHE